MSSLLSSPEDRAELYLRQHNLAIAERLGCGQEGIVWGTDRATAIKSFLFERHYVRERDVYLHLQKKLHDTGQDKVADFSVPKITDFEDRLHVLEMTIVSPPFVLDFATAGLGEPVRMTDEEQEAWREQILYRFEGDASRVRRVFYALQRYGVTLYDLHPGNVCCR